MLDLLNLFQEEQCHLALLTNEPDVVKKCWSEDAEIPPHVHMAGIITMEDIIECLLEEDIKDEFDRTPEADPIERERKLPGLSAKSIPYNSPQTAPADSPRQKL